MKDKIVVHKQQKPSATITIRLYQEDIERLRIRAIQNKTTVHQYVKKFILKDLHRKKKEE